MVAVVTRYFGGVLLGAGGLVRAYSDAVRAALADAGTLERRLMRRYDVRVDHATAGRLERDLRAGGVHVHGVDYAEVAVLHVAVPVDRDDGLAGMVAESTAGRAVLLPGGLGWTDAVVGSLGA